MFLSWLSHIIHYLYSTYITWHHSSLPLVVAITTEFELVLLQEDWVARLLLEGWERADNRPWSRGGGDVDLKPASAVKDLAGINSLRVVSVSVSDRRGEIENIGFPGISSWLVVRDAWSSGSLKSWNSLQAALPTPESPASDPAIKPDWLLLA